MLDLRWVAQNFDSVVERLSARGGNLDLGDLRALMAERSAVYPSLESLQAKRNAANEEMKRAAKEDPAALERLRGDLRALSQEIKELEKRRDAIEERLQAVNLTLPNVPDPSVPVGATEKDNVVVRTWGDAPRFPFTPRQHFELGEKLGLLDFERAAKVSGSRFVFYRGDLARLERALVAFMIDVHTARGLHRAAPAVPRDARSDDHHRAAPEVRGRRVQDRRPRGAVPHSHRRGAGHQLPRRRDPRGRPPPPALLRLQPLLPRGGRRRRARTPAA